jgi:hypothetical protein
MDISSTKMPDFQLYGKFWRNQQNGKSKTRQALLSPTASAVPLSLLNCMWICMCKALF